MSNYMCLGVMLTGREVLRQKPTYTRNRNSKWSKEEEDLLLKIYETESPQEICMKLNRKWNAIREYARKHLNIKRKKNGSN